MPVPSSEKRAPAFEVINNPTETPETSNPPLEFEDEHPQRNRRAKKDEPKVDDERAKFVSFRCPSCGYRFRAGPGDVGKKATCKCGTTVVVPATPPSANPSLACPHCHQLDAARKVSNIISQETVRGTSTSSSSGFIAGYGILATTHSTAVSQHKSETDLCKRLSPPLKPARSSIPTWFWVCAVLTVLVFFGSIVGLAERKKQVDSLIGIFFLSPLLAFLTYGLWRKIPEAQAQAKRRLMRWQKQYNFWKNAYYCHRCDGVYNPGDIAILSPERVFR
jgi:hypothetical protein